MAAKKDPEDEEDGIRPRLPSSCAASSLGGKEKDQTPLVLFRRRQGQSDDDSASVSGGIDVVEVAWPLNRCLREYQRAGVRFLFEKCFLRDHQRTHGAVLADEMGLGKTVQVIALFSALLGKTHRRGVDEPGLRRLRFGDSSRRVLSSGVVGPPFLVVCPASVAHNWRQELDAWGFFAVASFHHRNEREQTLKLARTVRIEVVVTTFETARDHIDDLNRVNWTAVVVDEVHKLKDPKAKVTKALKSLRCIRRIGLTGTLLQNSYEEFWCVLDWANPGCLGSLHSFVHKYANKIESGLRIDALRGELAQARQLQGQLDGVRDQFVLRRTKDLTNVGGQLPKKTDQVVFCQPSQFQMDVFEAILESPEMVEVLCGFERCRCSSGHPHQKFCQQRRDGKKTEETKKWFHLVFKYLHLFLKNASHPALLLPKKNKVYSTEQGEEGKKLCEIAFKKHRDFLDPAVKNNFLVLSDPKFSGKMSVLVDLLKMLEEEGDAKILVFSHSTTMLNILESFVQSLGYDYRRLDGQTRLDARARAVEEFNSDSSIFLFLISTKAGGLGLNLASANAVIVFDPSWNPAHDLQAQDRAYRIGQTRDVRVYRLVTAGTIEENIYLRQVYKQQLFKSAVDGENARRYFTAIRGQAKGELFGIKNLFAVRSKGDTCLTSRILGRNKAIENLIRGKRKIHVADNLLDYARHDGVSCLEDKDKGEALEDLQNILFEDLSQLSQGRLQKLPTAAPLVSSPLKSDKSILHASGRVVHYHVNQDLVGSSRVEDHVSRYALGGEGSSQELAALNCHSMAPTMAEDVRSSEEEEEALPFDDPSLLLQISSTSRANLRGDEERILRPEGETTAYFYGQTPAAIRRRDFSEMARFWKLSESEAAITIIEASPQTRAGMLKDFYLSKGWLDVASLYDKVCSEIVKEVGELREFDEREQRRSDGDDGDFKAADMGKKHRLVTSKVGHRTKRKKNILNHQGDSVMEDVPLTPSRVVTPRIAPKTRTSEANQESRLGECSEDGDEQQGVTAKPPKPAPKERFQSQLLGSRKRCPAYQSVEPVSPQSGEGSLSCPPKPAPKKRFRSAFAGAREILSEEEDQNCASPLPRPKPAPKERFQSQSKRSTETPEPVDRRASVVVRRPSPPLVDPVVEASIKASCFQRFLNQSLLKKKQKKNQES